MTRRERVIWLATLIAVVTLSALTFTNVIGGWALVAANVICVAFAVMRWRAEAGQQNRSADDGQECE